MHSSDGSQCHCQAHSVSHYQPAKLAAFEGHWETESNATLALIGWVDEARKETIAIGIPGMLSWLIAGDTDHVVTGLNAFPEDELPPINLTFQLYHIMVAIGMLLIGLTLVGFGTSTPELLTSVQAALSGAPAIAVGNVVGSNTANILLIAIGLGATAWRSSSHSACSRSAAPGRDGEDDAPRCGFCPFVSCPVVAV